MASFPSEKRSKYLPNKRTTLKPELMNKSIDYWDLIRISLIARFIQSLLTTAFDEILLTTVKQPYLKILNFIFDCKVNIQRVRNN